MMDTNMGSSIFQGGSVNVDNAAQNLEEEEEIEDLKRRQEEIQSLLTKAMDDFNYDDQSTVNSSVNESMDYTQQYKQAELDNQLQVMYNIRVKEVESLHEKMQAKEQQLADLKAQMVQSLMLSEADNDKLRTSLKNSQELLVDKCNQIQQLNDEKDRVLVDNDNLKQVLNKLEVEKKAVDYNNRELREKIAILERGRGTNPLSDTVLQENHHMEVTKLQHNLETAFIKIQRLEKENLTLAEKLKAMVSEKADLVANKTEVINKLMQNVDHAQEHNRELLNNVARLTAENERFRTQIQELESSVLIMKGFTDKTEIIKILQKELDKSKHLNTKLTLEFEKMHKEYVEVAKSCNTKSKQILLLEETVAALENKPTMNSNAMQTSKLMESFSVSDKLRDELESYKEQCRQKNMLTNGLQEKVQLLEEDVFNLNKKLELSSQRDSLTAALQEKATRLEEIILNNKKPSSDTKATNTDNIIPVIPQSTAPSDDVLCLYKTKFETDLIEKEIELRKELQLEFDQNYESMRQKYNICDKCSKLAQELKVKEVQIQEIQAKMLETVKASQGACEMCHDLSMNLLRNVEIIQQQEAELEHHRNNHELDRKTILQVMEKWKSAFESLEQENAALKQRLEGAIKSFTAAQTEAALVRKSEDELLQFVHVKAKEAAAIFSRDAMQRAKEYNDKIGVVRDKIDSISWKTDLQVMEIEKNFNKKQATIKQLYLREKPQIID